MSCQLNLSCGNSPDAKDARGNTEQQYETIDPPLVNHPSEQRKIFEGDENIGNQAADNNVNHDEDVDRPSSDELIQAVRQPSSPSDSRGPFLQLPKP